MTGQWPTTCTGGRDDEAFVQGVGETEEEPPRNPPSQCCTLAVIVSVDRLAGFVWGAFRCFQSLFPGKLFL